MNHIDLLIAARHANKLSVEELADRCGVHPQTVWKIERGAMKPSLEMVDKIAKVLNVCIEIGAVKRGK